jgi:hypothetical protein
MNELKEIDPAWLNDWGLLNSKRDVDTEENTFLWSLEYVLLRIMYFGHNLEDLRREFYGGNWTIDPTLQKMINDMSLYLDYMKNHHEMYDNHPIAKIDPSDKTSMMSHDQMSSYCIFSLLFMLDAHRLIWLKIVKKGLTYNNITGKFSIKRFVHPRDVIWIGYMNHNPICKRLMWLYWEIMDHTFATTTKTRPKFFDRVKHFFKTGKWPKTRKIIKSDVELISWCKKKVHQTLDKSDQWKREYAKHDKSINQRFGGWNGTFAEYFKDPEHPIRDVVDKVYL